MVDQKTIDAVKTFQVKNNLIADGIVGPKTLTQLNKISASTTSAVATTPDKWTLSCLNNPNTPKIEVLSPNGGEVYPPGQQVTVKWRS